MALQFDGNGEVSIPLYSAAGDFTIGPIRLGITATSSFPMGNSVNSQHNLGFVAGGATVRFDIAGVQSSVTGYTAGQTVDVTMSRVGAAVTLNVVESTGAVAPQQANSTSSATLLIDRLGSRNSANLYNGLMSGTFPMNGGAGGDRSYNTDQPIGTTNLPDSISGQDGTLSGFTTGGFDGASSETITITSIDDYHCIQRDSNGQAVFTIAGSMLLGGTVPTSIEISDNDGLTWSVLDAAPTTTSFTGSFTVTGQKHLTVRVSNNTDITDRKTFITASASIPAWWQSNEAGRGANNQPVTPTVNNPLPIMYKNGVFSPLEDPVGIDGLSAGSTWPLLASLLSSTGMPVCVANVAEGGTSVAKWLKGAPENLYQRIMDFHNDVGGFEFTTSIGGESDEGRTQAEIETDLNQMVNDLNSDFGTVHYLCYYPRQTALMPTKLAFDSVILTNQFCVDGGDLSVIDVSIPSGNDGTHMITDESIEQAGPIRFARITDTSTFSSTLNMSVTGAGNDTLDFDFYDRDTERFIKTESVTFTSDAGVVDFNLPVGTPIGGFYDGLTPPTTGTGFYGVTV